mgnify:CR=1 FL=1
MNCLRCGKEIQQPQVFCDDCLANGQRHPVKPDVLVRLPSRPSDSGKAPVKKEPPSPEKQIATLSRRNKHLTVALLCSLLALALSAVFLFHAYEEPEAPVPDIGKNYSTVSS